MNNETEFPSALHIFDLPAYCKRDTNGQRIHWDSLSLSVCMVCKLVIMIEFDFFPSLVAC